MDCRKLLVSLTTAMLSMAICAAVQGAPSSKPSAKPAKFDQQAVLTKLWAAKDDATVATVGGQKITKIQLMEKLWFWSAPTVLKDLINQAMVDEAAKKAGVTATQKEIDAKMDEAVKKMGAPDADALLRQYNVTKQRVLDGNRLNVLVEKVVRKQVGASSFDLSGWVKARHILVKFVQTETDAAKKDADARKKIDEIALKVKDGDFEKLAKEFSEDEGSKASGGDLGWFGRGRMLKEFEDAVFGLKPGQVSDPVKTFYGYHIIKLEKTGKDATVAEKNDLMKTVVDGKVQEEMTKWFANLASKTKSDNYLVDKTPATPFGPQMGPRPMPKQGSPNPGGSRPAPPAEKPQPAVPEAPPPPPSQ